MWLYMYALLAVEDLPCLSAKCHSKFGVDKLHSYVQMYCGRLDLSE